MSIRPLLIGAAMSAFAVNAWAQPQTPPSDVPPPPPPTTTSPSEPTPPSTNAPATATPPVAPLPPAPPPPPPPPPPAGAGEAPPPPPKKLTVGTGGFFQPGLLLQGWFIFDGCPSCTSPTPSSTSSFRIRRAEVHIKGEIVPGVVNYAVMFDPAKVLEWQNSVIPVANAPMTTPAEQVTVRQPVSAISALQDVFITFPTDYAEFSLGQFKIPVSWEGYNSAAKIVFPERSLVSRQYGDRRDLGLRIAKTFQYFGYSAGVFNGGGLNNLDTNNQKDLGLRLEAYPIPGVTVAGVIYGSVGQRNRAGTKDRYEGDLRFEQMGILLQAEYIYANDLSVDYGASVNGQGFYVVGGYTFFDALQPILRIGRLDPNTGKDSDEMWEYGAGVNYYIRKHEAKLQLNYNKFPQSKNEDEVIFAAQVSF